MRIRLVGAIVVLLCITNAGFAAAKQVRKQFRVGRTAKLIIKADPARVMVEVGDSNQIVLDVELPSDDLCSILTDQIGNKVTVELQPKGTWGVLAQRLRLYEADVTVKVPPDCDIVLVSQSGSIEVRGVAGELRSRSGTKTGQILRWIFRIGQM